MYITSTLPLSGLALPYVIAASFPLAIPRVEFWNDFRQCKMEKQQIIIPYLIDVLGLNG